MARSNAKSFTAAVARWVEETEAASLEVARDAVREFVSEYKAAAPRDTGNLANSITVATSPEQLVQGAPDQVFSDNAAANDGVIDAMQMGDHLYVAALAPYNAKIEYGYHKKDGTPVQGHFFGHRTAAQWRGFVRRVAKLKGLRAK